MQAFRMLRSEEYGGAQSRGMCVRTTVWAQLYHSACVLVRAGALSSC
jgi:hypothetical protein